MPLPPQPAPTLQPPIVRQSAILQNATPDVRVAVNLPLASLATGKVIAVLVTTISGGTVSHVPTYPDWRKVNLGGTDGYARLGNLLVSAWELLATTSVYNVGFFRFQGLVGLAPEYYALSLYEMDRVVPGQAVFSGSYTWNASANNLADSGEIKPISYQNRGIIAVGVAEGQHVFSQPQNNFYLEHQTSHTTGASSVPFSIAGTFVGQPETNSIYARMPFDGAASPSGTILLNVLGGESTGITLVSPTYTTDSYLAYPSAKHTADAFTSSGFQITHTIDAYSQYDPFTLRHHTNSILFGGQMATHTTDIFSIFLINSTHTTDSYLESFTVVTHVTDAGLLGQPTLTHTTDALSINDVSNTYLTDSFINPKDLSHTTDTLIISGQAIQTTDSLMIGQVSIDHTTDAFRTQEVSLTHSTDALTIGPPTLSHSTDAYMLGDNVLAMTGWELGAVDVESDPKNYVGSTFLTVSAVAKRPDSLGAYGLRANYTIAGVIGWWSVGYNSQGLRDTTGTYPLRRNNDYISTTSSEIWITFNFSINSGGGEEIISDAPDTGFVVDGDQYYSYSLRSESGKLYLYCGSTRFGSGFPYTAGAWYKVEIRLSTPSPSIPLGSTSVVSPLSVDVYIDHALAISGTSTMPCKAQAILGIQYRRQLSSTEMFFDDLVITPRRLDVSDFYIKAYAAVANGAYLEFSGTPSATFAAVDNIPYNTGEHIDSSTNGQRFTIKPYTSPSTNPFPDPVYAVAMHVVCTHSGSHITTQPDLLMMVREGSTDLEVIGIFTHTSHSSSRTYADHTLIYSYSPVAGASWAATIYDFQVGVKNITSSYNNQAQFLGVSLLVTPTTAYHTADSMLLGATSQQHTTDSFLGKSLSHKTDSYLATDALTHTTDSFLYKVPEAAQTTDSALSSSPTLTHSTDALIDRYNIHTTDGLIVAQKGAVFTTDAYISGQTDLGHPTDAFIWRQVDLTYSTDAVVYRLVETIHTADSLMIGNPILLQSTDAGLIGAINATHTTNALLQATFSATHTADSLKYATLSGTHTTDSLRIGQIDATHTTSSMLLPTATVNRNHPTDAFLVLSPAPTHTADSYSVKLVIASHTTDSTINGSTSALQTTDSLTWLPQVNNKVHTTDADLFGSSSPAHTTDAVNQATFLLAYTTDSFLLKFGLLTHTADALIWDTYPRSHITSSFLYAMPSPTHTADALLYKQFTLNHTADSFIIGQVDRTHTADSLLNGQVDLTHISSSSLQATVSPTHTTDALAAHDLVHTADSLINLLTDRIHYCTSTLSGEASALHTTSAMVYAEMSPVFSTDADLNGEANATHLTMGSISGTPSLSHTTDARTAADAAHYTDSTLNGATGANHTSDAFLFKPEEEGIFEPPVFGGVLGGAFE